MTREEAIQKAMKLLALSKSDNVHEAASAAARAQEILSRYEIDAAMLNDTSTEPDEAIENFMHKGSPLDDLGNRAATWKSGLANIVAKANQCRVYLDGGLVAIVGRPSAVETVRYLYGMLVSETEKLTAKNGVGCGRTWRNNYRLGVIVAIKEKFAASAVKVIEEVRAENPNALVRVESALETIKAREAAVDEFLKSSVKLRKISRGGARGDKGAYEQGKSDGRTINVNSARGALGGAGNKLTA